jgi:hypothetical protein
MTFAASYQLLLTFVAESAADPISEMDRLGGMLNYYYRDAA